MAEFPVRNIQPYPQILVFLMRTGPYLGPRRYHGKCQLTPDTVSICSYDCVDGIVDGPNGPTVGGDHEAVADQQPTAGAPVVTFLKSGVARVTI